jgi:hypothetical protein
MGISHLKISLAHGCGGTGNSGGVVQDVEFAIRASRQTTIHRYAEYKGFIYTLRARAETPSVVCQTVIE